MQISEPAEYALLGLLWSGPQYGYELIRAFGADQDLGVICRLEQSQLYAFLKKLEQLGYLAGTLEPQEGRPPRRMEALTPTGRAEFRRWVEAPVPKPREVRLQFLLKLYFARAFGAETIARLITQQIDACNVFLRKLPLASGASANGQTAHPTQFEPVHDFRAIIHQARIRQIEATIAWLIELRDQATEIATAG